MGLNRKHEAGHLLVVDDNKVNRLLLGRGLEQQGHVVDFAVNGRQALEKLRAQPFDLVLLDIEMPEMNGYQVLEQLVKDVHLRDTPVIVTSSLEELDSVVRCIELGAEDYLTKPVNPVLLRARINASLEKKRLRDTQKELVRRFATPEVAADLEEWGFALGGKFVEATVMFSDIRGFTTISESQSPADTIGLLNTYYTLMFDAISGHGGAVNQMVGDGLMAIFGAPIPLPGHAESAVLAALEMIELIELFNVEQVATGKLPIRIGIGIATGQVIAGYTGTQHRATYTCVGAAVNVAARLEAFTKTIGHPILIDIDTRQSLSAALQVEDCGPVELKGKSQATHVYRVIEGQVGDPKM
jgi:class 3 adenylate cyclase